MFSNRAGIQLIPLIAAAMFIPPGLANEVSWIQGQTCPSAWSVEPVRPRDTDVIQFSGPVRFYLNRCLAERTLGGKPRLLVDHTGRTIELRFEPPASSDCTGFWSPVCGLKGSFGPLDGGQWRFFSNVGGTTFSVEFAVGGDAAIQFFCYVDPNAPGAGTGSSWKDALNSLQDALAIAGEGTEIRVARGAYRPDAGADIERGDRNATF